MAPVPGLPHRCRHHPGHHGGRPREPHPRARRGRSLAVLAQATAAHNSGGTVIAQVKRVVAPGTLDPQKVKGSGHPGGCPRGGPGAAPEHRESPTIRPSAARSAPPTFPVEPLPLGPGEGHCAPMPCMQIHAGRHREPGLRHLVHGSADRVRGGGLRATELHGGAGGGERAAPDGLRLRRLAQPGGNHRLAGAVRPDRRRRRDGRVSGLRRGGRCRERERRADSKAQPHVLAGAGGFINIAHGDAEDHATAGR
ncbi:MAG: hypothetical protein MZU79_08835 [Anaerotruncus sp.]|nr:hypothetical protein [Anaerotruncus sp.]